MWIGWHEKTNQKNQRKILLKIDRRRSQSQRFLFCHSTFLPLTWQKKFLCRRFAFFKSLLSRAVVRSDCVSALSQCQCRCARTTEERLRVHADCHYVASLKCTIHEMANVNSFAKCSFERARVHVQLLTSNSAGCRRRMHQCDCERILEKRCLISFNYFKLFLILNSIVNYLWRSDWDYAAPVPNREIASRIRAERSRALVNEVESKWRWKYHGIRSCNEPTECNKFQSFLSLSLSLLASLLTFVFFSFSSAFNVFSSFLLLRFIFAYICADDGAVNSLLWARVVGSMTW